jgi:hypothetical protein
MEQKSAIQIGTRQYVLSLAAGILITGVIVLASSLRESEIGILLAPGMFGAALVFREGVHSDSPMGWIALTAVLDVLLYSAAVLGTWVLIARSREKRLRRAGQDAR